jgi:hypothetical protein
MLAHLRRRWSLSGKEGFEIQRFSEMKRLFSTAPNAKKRRRTEVTEVTGRGLCLTGRVRSVLSVCARLGLLIGRSGTSGHDRPDASGHGGCLLDSNQTLALWRPVRLACASGH